MIKNLLTTPYCKYLCCTKTGWLSAARHFRPKPPSRGSSLHRTSVHCCPRKQTWSRRHLCEVCRSRERPVGKDWIPARLERVQRLSRNDHSRIAECTVQRRNLSIWTNILHTLLPPKRNNEVLSKLLKPLKYPVPYSRTKRYQSFLNYALAHFQNSKLVCFILFMLWTVCCIMRILYRVSLLFVVPLYAFTVHCM